MTIEDIAKKLDGSQYPVRIERAFKEELKANGIVVVYGHSDDCVLFGGAINDESYVGTKQYIYRNGFIPVCENEDCPHQSKMDMSEYIWIKGNFGDSMEFKTNLSEYEYETFTVYDDDYVYCVGMVFKVDSL